MHKTSKYLQCDKGKGCGHNTMVHFRLKCMRIWITKKKFVGIVEIWDSLREENELFKEINVSVVNKM